ncbi:MAG: DUF1674 domain-containing protein [Steroidobacteraceae bacterium]|nr:DUF1674 domain-containing protein [Steroidobacteraceae bacterium]
MQNSVESSDAPGSETPAQPGAAQGRPGTPGSTPRPVEIGGPTGPEPTRYGDWEKKGRCIDF